MIVSPTKRVVARLSAGLCLCVSLSQPFSRLVAQPPADHGFVVYAADPATFVVARTRADQQAAEGFVIDRDNLVARLRQRVLDEQGLGELARVAAVAGPTKRNWLADPSSPTDRIRASAGAYRYNHRFAPPFEGLQAQLDLAPLRDEDDASGLLYTLTVVLALAVILGLYALYRMVAVQMRFAEVRNNFVAAVSHELKTPLTAIRMYGEMLRDDLVESDQKRREYYATISSETERLSRLINNVLEFSRLERDERPVQLVVGDVRTLVAEAVELFRPHATQEGFTLSMVVPDRLPPARFDRDALTQILFNLLDNALKYGAGEQRAIEVRCKASEQGVEVTVSDRGPGVDATHLRAIFEPFYRGQNELTRTRKGTGIGLALVRDLVRRMHGSVRGHNLQPGFAVHVTLPQA
ncbi:MAG: HAMP domain-containing sensor histidine kinase [Myxococcales bacterium]|nr:HAMP domain-containing sensor histidine kinase [Myxococcales bacterium]